MKSTFQTLLFALIFILFIGCEDRDDTYSPIDSNLEIKDFVWKGLNYYYYWQEDVDDLGDNRFSNNKDYSNFLRSFMGPEELFEALKYSGDRFSWIVDDYEVLENALGGITQSNGMEFGLSYIDKNTSNKLVGFVRYVLPNSDAADKNIKRGDLFNAVNGTELTIENYRNLLFSDASSYTIEMASIENGSIVPNGTSIELTKEANFQENPVHINKILNLGGKKIGYLMYNGFIESFDQALESTLMQFQNEGIDELVLDFRYNPGGRVSSAIKLASMITGSYIGEIFAIKKYNQKINDNNPNFYFTSTSVKLNMNKVYILTSSSTASASELIINGLKPYIEIIQVGDSTVGKNVASSTIKDWIDSKTINPNHKWAMQPIILKISNSEGFADFENGLPPTVEIKEQIGNLGILGDQGEPLLAKALQHMGVVPGIAKPKSKIIETQEVSNSKSYWEIMNGSVIDLPVGEITIPPHNFQVAVD